MPKISEEFNIGVPADVTPEDLLRAMTTMYRELAVAINKKPDIITRNTDGQATETFLANGDININLSTNKVEMVTNHTSPTNVTWTTI